MEEILNLLQNNARLALEDIAAMTKKTAVHIRLRKKIPPCTTLYVRVRDSCLFFL